MSVCSHLLPNGRDNIGLKVMFNHYTLGLHSSQVVSEKDAWTGARLPLHIEAVVPVEGFRQGEYYASVHIIFESLLPGEPHPADLSL